MAADLLFDLFRCDRHFVVDQNIPQDALGEGFVRFSLSRCEKETILMKAPSSSRILSLIFSAIRQITSYRFVIDFDIHILGLFHQDRDSGFIVRG